MRDIIIIILIIIFLFVDLNVLGLPLSIDFDPDNGTIFNDDSSNIISDSLGGSDKKTDSGSSSYGSSSGSSSNDKTSSSGDDYVINATKAQQIANQHIKQDGWYAGIPTHSENHWHVPVHDADGNHVDIISVHDTTGKTSRG